MLLFMAVLVAFLFGVAAGALILNFAQIQRERELSDVRIAEMAKQTEAVIARNKSFVESLRGIEGGFDFKKKDQVN